jgi:hypothetical protein
MDLRVAAKISDKSVKVYMAKKRKRVPAPKEMSLVWS